MSFRIQVPKHQLTDLKRIVDVGTPRLQAVHQALKTVNVPILHPQKVLAIVERELPLGDAEALVRQLLAVQGLARQSGADLEEVFSVLRSAIERQGREEGLEVEAWSGVEEAMKALAGEQSIRLAAAAIELSYDYANLLRRTKILTDIRPLYDRDADAVEGAVISFTLRLRYDSADGEHEVSIALDEADIKILSQQCQRAVRKAATARSLMGQCNIATAVSGETSDG